MPVHKAPEADLRRRYPLYAEVGLALALGLAILAFTVPTPVPEPEPFAAEPEAPVTLTPVPPTAEAPPPPPPPAPPPPVEIPDDEAADDEAIAEIVLDPSGLVPPPAGLPPAPVAAPPTVAGPPPPPPPPAPPVTDDEVITLPEIDPELIGGLAGLQRSVEYPELARRIGVEGRVILQFVVDERGEVVDPVVVRSPHDLLSEAALEAVRQARFRPGQQRGRPVKVRFSLPVVFRLR